MMKATRVYKLNDNDVARLATLAVSPEWLTFTAIAIGGVEFANKLSSGEEVIFVHEGEIFKSSGD